MKNPRSKRQFKKILKKMLDSTFYEVPDDYVYVISPKYAGFNIRSFGGHQVRIMNMPNQDTFYLTGDPIFKQNRR